MIPPISLLGDSTCKMSATYTFLVMRSGEGCDMKVGRGGTTDGRDTSIGTLLEAGGEYQCAKLE